MVRKVCLDSDALIEIIHGTKKGVRAVEEIENTKIFTTSINIFELFSREDNVEEVQKNLSEVDTVDFGKEAAVVASQVRKDLNRKGKMIDFRDVFIAAIAKENGAELLTFNKKHFENIEGLKLVEI